MANLNKVMLIGNLTRDPESKFLPSGQTVCELGMAINRHFTDQSGEKREQTCFVDLTAFGRQAETLAKYMKKGRTLYVEGRLDFQTWESKEGQRRSKLKVIVENFQFLGGREDAGSGAPQGGGGYGGSQGGGGGGSQSGSFGGGGGQNAPQQQQQQAGGGSQSPMNLDEDDIPF